MVTKDKVLKIEGQGEGGGGGTYVERRVIALQKRFSLERPGGSVKELCIKK